MSYCIAIHSDIETLKMVRDRLLDMEFEHIFDSLDCGDEDYIMLTTYKWFCYHYKVNLEPNCDIVSTTPETLHETIDLVIKKLKENE